MKNRITFTSVTHEKLVKIAGHVMLSFLVVILYSGGLWAQNATFGSGNEYGKIAMSQYLVADNAQYSSTDPTVNLTVECIDANGYGQWTVSSLAGNKIDLSSTSGHHWTFSPNQVGGITWSPNSTTTTNYWFLLGNLLAKPSEKSDGTSSHPGCQPPGIVSGGPFNKITGGTVSFNAAKSKVKANLLGATYYVSVLPDNSKFIMEGFNTAPSPGGATVSQQIDISLNGLPNGTTTNDSINRQIIRKPIFTFPASGTGTDTVSTGGRSIDATESGYRDEFDIAIDTKFLYIVWNHPNGANNEIWVTAVPLDGSAVPTGFPMKLDPGSAKFTRPTIDCDKRGPHNGGGNPEFAVSFIGNVAGGTGTVTIVKDINGTVTSETLNGATSTKAFIDPFNGTTVGYTDATHARILVSSVSGVSPPQFSLYVECDVFAAGPPQIDYHLIFYKNLQFAGDGTALYVDGQSNLSPHNSFPAPMTSTGYTLAGIVDGPIMACGNPYDAQNTNAATFNQFHCLYQPKYTKISSTTFIPLQIIRGCDNGFAHAGSTDTRVLLNQDNNGLSGGLITGSTVRILDDPSNYCIATNQMGIHIHWRTSSATHFYVRDTRAFDEDIEENTLVTNKCVIGDGSSSGSNHGGTVGAKLLNGVKLTIYSDPNYGANGGSTNSGMYWQYPGTTSADGIFLAKANIGTLNFNTTGLALTVGSTDGTAPANLYTMPLCYISNTSVGSSTGTITVNQKSTWDYFGSNITSNWNASDGPTVNLSGPGAGPVPTTANLNIHGGAIFWECPSFNATFGRIDILYEANIYPISTSGCFDTTYTGLRNDCFQSLTSSVNCPVSGLLQLGSIATINHSNINSFISIRDWFEDEGHLSTDVMKNVVMLITKVNGLSRSTRFSLNSTNNHYTNCATPDSASTDPPTPGGSSSVILYDGRESSDNQVQDKVVFNNDVFTRVRFHGISPGPSGLELTLDTIKDWDEVPIHIENGLNGVLQTFGYDDIKIEHNTFRNLLFGGCNGVTDHPFDPAQGILIRNFNTTGSFAQVNVNNNNFTFFASGSGHSLSSTFDVEAAIEFDNSTGNIENNNIEVDPTKTIYQVGIWAHNSFNSNPISPYLCNNTITGLTNNGGIGIESDHNQGYVNKCTIDSCDVGYESGPSDNPKIIHSIITNSKLKGIYVFGTPSAEVDLRGIHSAPGCTTCDDFAANNNISNNGTLSTHAQILLGDQNQLVDLGNPAGSGWGSWGKNKIITTGTPMLISTLSTPLANIGSFDQNNWGSINPYSPACPEAHFSVTYTCGETIFSPWFDSSSWFSCSGYSGSERIESKGSQTLSLQSWGDTCTHLKVWEAVSPANEEEAQKQYDTLQLYIERCAISDSLSWRAFLHLDGADQFRSADTNRFIQYRAWLISVLYLNKTVPQYFCACMESITTTYQKTVEVLAIWNYLRHNHLECWGQSADKQYSQDSATASHSGEDPNHLPSLDSLGLGFLLKSGVTPTIPFAGQDLGSFTSSPNPFNHGTILEFTLYRMTYTTVAVYDELGKLVWGDGRGSSLETGVHSVQIDGTNLPSGTLYARISTGFGEVKTVKLVHEK